MPNKYAEKKGWKVPKQKYKVTNWSEYNAALRSRGRIDVWISPGAVDLWYEEQQPNDGTGAQNTYSDFAILTCHELRIVYRLPLRQSQGFIDSLFEIMGLPLKCPDYSVLSKRLGKLGIKVPKYLARKDTADENVHAVAIDSTGLKRFGRSEWHQEKYELSNKASWRKLHVAINQDHYIEAAVLTDRYSTDDQEVENLLEQIKSPIDHFTADGAYDKTPVYNVISNHSANVNIVIPPQVNAVYDDKAAVLRNRNILEIKKAGRMEWQRNQEYGKRNYSELGIQRYKRIIGPSLGSREMPRQIQEAMIGCGIINKMTALGMPQSHRSA